MPSLSSSSEDEAPTTKPKTTATQSFLSDEEDEKVSKLQKRRLEFEKMRQERERQYNKRNKRNNNRKEDVNNGSSFDDDDDSEVDLLAAESPLASPSPPQSPLHNNDNNGFRRRNNNDNRNNNYTAATTMKKKSSLRSPSSLSPSPNRVAFAATTMKKNNQSQQQQQKTSKLAMNQKKSSAWGDDSSDDSINNSNKWGPSKRLHPMNNARSKKKGPPPKPKKENPLDSSDEEGFAEKMKLKLREKKRKEEMTKKKKQPTIGPSSPFKSSYQQRSTTAAAATAAVGADIKKRNRLQLSSDEDSDDMSSKLQARKQAEREAKYNRHNPIHIERKDREIWEEEQQRRLRLREQQEQQRIMEDKGLEGTTILIDGADQKSVSEMGDDHRVRRGGDGGNGGGDGGGSTTAANGSPSPNWKTSRRKYSPSGGGTSLKRDDESSSPLRNKKQRVIIDSDEDGLWDDVDNDVMKGDDDDDDDDGKKKTSKGRRGRPKNSSGMKDATNAAADAKTTQPRKRQRGRGAPKIDDNDDDDDDDNGSLPPVQGNKRQAKGKKKGATSKKQNHVSRYASLLQDSDDDGDDIDENGNNNSMSAQDKENMKRDLKPTFANPKMGAPSALVPFVLTKEWKVGDPVSSDLPKNDSNQKSGDKGEDEDEEHVVPASINRYLAPYQRVGIQFMYSNVINGKGCVLGDDMGLGKTVQMVSLVAALLKKTGTALDKENIQTHRRKALKAVKIREENDRQALLSGMCSRIKNTSILDEVGLPKFAPILVIVPPSVAQNWENEFATWGHFNVAPIYGGSSREKALDRIKTGLDFILIVGKSIFSRADDFDALNTVNWKLIIVDEFHEYKNHESVAHMRLEDLRKSSRCPVIGMTGTLMQNNHKELFYLIDLVRPNLFGDWSTFRMQISDPLKYARAKDAKPECVAMGKDRQKELDRILKPVYLVRKKEVSLKGKLTKKNEKVIFCQLSEIQKKLYRHILTLPDYDLVRFANAPCDCGVNRQYFQRYKKLKTKKEQVAYQRRHKDELVPKKQCCYRYPLNPYRDEDDNGTEPYIDPDAVIWRQMHEKPIGDPNKIAEDILDDKYIVCQNCPTCVQLPAMMKLMKICSHPSLLQVPHSETGESKRKKLEFAEVALPPEIRSKLPGGTLYQFESLTNDHVKLSGKMKTLDHLLKKFQRQRHRVLVFSHSTATLDIIQNHCRISGWEHLRLDGKTPSSSRQGLVDKFQKNDDIFLFLISTKAGGLGLNLTAANKVIIFDVNWNPSYDEQAQDRAFRIGQKQDVEAIRLVARGTIEELIYQRQVYKVQLRKQTLESTELGEDQPQIFRAVDKDKNRKGELFGIENLLKFKDGSFMSSLWKRSDNPMEAIDQTEVQAELDKRTEEDLDELAEREDQGPLQNDESGNETSENEYEGIDHGDYFNKQRGQARVVQGDDAFDEEMGGVSQMIAATTMAAVQNEYSSDEDDYTSDDQKPEAKPDVKPSVKSMEEEKSSADNDFDASKKPAAKPDAVKSDAKADQEVTSPADGSAPVSSNDKNEPANSEEEEEKDTEERSVRANNDLMSPEPSTGTQSLGSLDGLRTQHEPTPKTDAKKKASGPGKFSLMGAVFENTPKKNQEKKPSGSGLYIPSYK